MPEVATRRTISRNAARGRRDITADPPGAVLRARLLAVGWHHAHRPGACDVCEGPFYPPQVLRLLPITDPIARRRYRAECCPGEDRG